MSANQKEKKQKLEDIKYETRTLIIYEAPHKLKNTLEECLEILGDRKIVLAREITKIHEEFIRGSIKDILNTMEEVRGEYVIIIEGSLNSKKDLKLMELNEKTIEEHYSFYEKQGLEKKEIIKKIAKDRNINKNEIYQQFLNK